jgi:hypothetical protein
MLGTFRTIGPAPVRRHPDNLKSPCHPRRWQGRMFAFPFLCFPTSTNTLDIASPVFGNAHFQGLIPIDVRTGAAYNSTTLENASLFRTTVNLNRKPLCARMLPPPRSNRSELCDGCYIDRQSLGLCWRFAVLSLNNRFIDRLIAPKKKQGICHVHLPVSERVYRSWQWKCRRKLD